MIFCVLSLGSGWRLEFRSRYVIEEIRYDGWIARSPVCASLRVGCLVSAMRFPLVQPSLSPGPRCTMTECVSPFPLQPKRGKQCYIWLKRLNKDQEKVTRSVSHKLFHAILCTFWSLTDHYHVYFFILNNMILLPKIRLCSEAFGKTWGLVNDMIDGLISDFFPFLQPQVS